MLFPQLAPARRARRLRGPAGDDRRRHAADRAAADPGRRGDARAGRRRSSGSSTSAASSTPSRPTLTAEALFWFAFSLPFSGWNLLLTRTFFSLQKPWLPTIAGRRLARASTPPSRSRCTSRWGSPASCSARSISNAALTVLPRPPCCAASSAGSSSPRTLARGRRDAARRGGRCWAPSPTASGAALDDVLGRLADRPDHLASAPRLALGRAGLRGVVLALRIPEARQILDLFASTTAPALVT